MMADCTGPIKYYDFVHMTNHAQIRVVLKYIGNSTTISALLISNHRALLVRLCPMFHNVQLHIKSSKQETRNLLSY